MGQDNFCGFDFSEDRVEIDIPMRGPTNSDMDRFQFTDVVWTNAGMPGFIFSQNHKAITFVSFANVAIEFADADAGTVSQRDFVTIHDKDALVYFENVHVRYANGPIHISACRTLSIKNSTFESTRWGGALHISGIAPKLLLSNVTFRDSVGAMFGGAVRIDQASSMQFFACDSVTCVNNEASVAGGCLYIAGGNDGNYSQFAQCFGSARGNSGAVFYFLCFSLFYLNFIV